jgi:hypothetical protein
MYKDGLDCRFKVGDFVKIRGIFNDLKWYTDKPLKIKNVNNQYYDIEIIGNFHISNVFQDYECIIKQRKKKLEKLNRE